LKLKLQRPTADGDKRTEDSGTGGQEAERRQNQESGRNRQTMDGDEKRTVRLLGLQQEPERSKANTLARNPSLPLLVGGATNQTDGPALP
jgi:hypothetical protein